MNLSAPFIKRPVATTLLSLALALLGALSYRLLPVAPMPEIDFPVITVSANLAGASPEVMAATVATPLERALGQIAGIDKIGSNSGQGATRIFLVFKNGVNINNAAREVQAAINTAAPMLPDGMRNLPSLRKINPTDAPIMALALTSNNLAPSKLYDLASSVLAQKIAQIPGVGDVNVGGSSLPAVRIKLEPNLLNQHGISLDEVRRIVTQNNIRMPHGAIADDKRLWHIQTNEQLTNATQYQNLIIRADDEHIVRLKDVAQITDDVENRYNRGFFNQQEAVLITVQKEAGANIIATLEQIKQLLPSLHASLPNGVKLEIASDRSLTIIATKSDAEHTLIIAIMLVIGVVFLALGNIRASLIPVCAVPLSLIASCIFMYFGGFSLNILTFTALILATGLVVDDAIVVVENIARYLTQGYAPIKAAMLGAKEVGFTLLAMNLSLITVFISILFMGGILAQLFYEFTLSLAAAILVSLIVSLTLTPMLCAKWLSADIKKEPTWQVKLRYRYGVSLSFVLRYKVWVLWVLLLIFGLNIYLYISIPKVFLPLQDTGQITGFVRGDQGLSFKAMSPKIDVLVEHILSDPAVASISGFVGGNRGVNSSFLLIKLKPIAERKVSVHKIVERMRGSAPNIAGARLFLMPTQDVRFGRRMNDNDSSEYQVTVQGDDVNLLRNWLPKITQVLMDTPEITAVDGKMTAKAQQITLEIDRQTAKRLGVDMEMISSVLNNSFSQRQVATIYETLNQYKVVMEVDAKYADGPKALDQVEVITKDGKRVALSTIANYRYSLVDDGVSHDEQFVSEGISFDTAENITLAEAISAIEYNFAHIGLPSNLIIKFGGTADAFKQAQTSQSWLMLAAIVLVYLVLGILYESYIHPLTILSTLPSAGIGALLTLMIFGQSFSLISLLGLFLLIGIVMKNAILMIDLSLQFMRTQFLSCEQAIYEACMLRLRPILMTTLAAICGAIPLLLSSVEGAEMRKPLGISIIGGLVLSQILTLYSTPIVFIYLDKLSWKIKKMFKKTPQIAES